MAANIKGLTVEIGGDTTKLGKALENVNKKSRDLSGELGQINRLLKLDPGNTDLLAQKQQVLGEAIANTRSKLDTLKEAEKQVQAQFERGEVSEEQYRALQREIVATEQKLQGYENAAQETEDALRGVNKETKEAKKSSGELGDKLGKVAVAGFKAVAAAATAAIGALVASAESTREYRVAMGKLETAFTTSGFSAEAATGAYKELQGVLGDSDQAVEAANHLAQLTDNEQDLATWTGDILPGVFATFGDSLPIEGLTEAANETAKVGQVTGPLADALNWAGVSEDGFNESLAKCSTEQERQALITETLAGLYGEAAEAYKETNAEVIRANQANEEWTASMAEIGGAIEPILTDVKMMGAALLSDLVPGVKQLAQAFRDLLNGDAGAAGAIGEALSGILTQLLDLVVQLAPTLITVAVSLLTTLTTTLISRLPDLLSTLAEIIVNVVTALSESMPQIIAAVVAIVPQLITTLVGFVPELLQAAVTLFMAIVQALPEVITALIDALPTVVNAIITALLDSIPILIDAAVQLLMAIVQAIPQILGAISENLPLIIDTLINGLISYIPIMIEGAVQLLMAIVQAIPTIVVALAKNLPRILKAVIDGLKKLPTELWNKVLNPAINKVVEWAGSIVAKAKEAAGNFLTRVSETLAQLPGKIGELLTTALNNVVTWGSNMVSKARTAASNTFNAIVNGLSSLPSRIRSIGSNLVRGLWNGINDKFQWLVNKISSFTNSVLGKIKSFFGVESPSKKTAEIGRYLSEGLAVGIDDAVDAPVNAMRSLSGDVLDAAADGLNGLTLDRQLNATFGTQAGTAAGGDGLMAKLDKILTAIEAGQVLAIDGDTLVGATATRYDRALGQRRALAARGAI